MSNEKKMCDCNQGWLLCICKPAKQHQGEPVARTQFDYDLGFTAGSAECETLRGKLAHLRSDSDQQGYELEKCKRLLQEERKEVKRLQGLVSDLRAQLDDEKRQAAFYKFGFETKSAQLKERDALLSQAQSFVEAWDDDSQEWADLSSAISNALSASAEPSVHVVRRAFVCTGCEGIYADKAVSACDCCVTGASFIEGTISYFNSEGAALERKP